MRKINKFELTPRLIFTTIIVSGLIIGVFVMSVTNILLEIQKAQTIQQKLNKTLLISDFLEHTFTDRIYKIAQIAKNPTFQNFTSIDQINKGMFGVSEEIELEKREKLKSVIYYNPNLSAIGLFLPNGDIYLAEPYSSQLSLKDKNFSFRDWYKGVTLSLKPYISESYITQYTNKTSVAFAAPIIMQNNLVGIVQATLSMDDIAEFLQNVKIGNGAEILIVDHRGNIVLSKSSEHEVKYNDVSFDKINQNFNKHNDIITRINGQDTLVLRSAIQAGENQWYLFFFQPADIAFNTVIETQVLIITIMIMIYSLLAISGITVFYGIKKNQKVTKSLKEANNDLKNFMSALDESSIVALTDRNGTITYVNDKFCEISKYSKDELIGQNHRLLKSGHHSPEFYVGIWKAITSGHTWNGNIKNKAKDGSYYWVKTTIVPFLGDDGKPEKYIAVRTDITSQKIQEENLQYALVEIQEADKLKEEFSTMVSHELKTPLTPIKGYCEMLMDPEVFGETNQEQKEAIKEIERNAIRLERLIADMLDVQKLDMGRMIINKEPFDVAKFLTEIKTDLSTMFTDKQVTLVINSEISGSITSDKNRLRQILDNLIKNAVDFVPPKTGIIEIQVKREKTNIIFSVKDNGIGIPKEAQGKLFRKFYQVDTSHTRKHGGTGLGLVVCKEIVKLLGGKIWFESEIGKGTKFYFSISEK